MLYWLVANNHTLQNKLLFVSSYFFYACWDWRFLFLLGFSTLLDYYTGLQMAQLKNQNIKRQWLWASITVNLAFLGFFKYYNFFAGSFLEAVGHLGVKVNPWTLKVILPLGISFYTFHGISYVIDVYKNKIRPEKSFITYAVFVSFFPLLVAGPIERATHLLPQIREKRIFDYTKIADGLRQILWGLFKKVVIADSCAIYANMVFEHPADYTGSTLLIGILFFAFQIYGDFSGYSDIALGTARLFGIELLRNFAFPYFSRSIAEFWRCWHISLATWFRDYLYIPLGGNSGSIWLRIRNLFIIFLVSGFWHGANWTFIVWGFLNAVYMLPAIVLRTNRKHLDMVAKGKWFPSFQEGLSISATFILTMLAWIFFRAKNVTQAFSFLSIISSSSVFKMPRFEERKYALVTGLLISLFMVTEWIGREQPYALAQVRVRNKWLRWLLYSFIIFLIGMYMQTQQTPFIYFQF